MNKTLGMSLALTSTMLASTAIAQEIYAPTRAVSDQGITLTGWGSGRIAESTDKAVEGSTSLRISSRNFFQGGLIKFANPVDLSGLFGDKTNLLQFTFNVASVTGGSGGGAPGGIGRPGTEGGGSMDGGAPGSIGRPGTGGAATTTASGKAVEMIRVLITTSDGRRSEAYLDIKTSVANPQGWFNIGLPLSAINGFERTNKQITSIGIAGDSVATFYLGMIKMFSDTTPVYAEPNVRELNLAFGDQVNFIANGYAGATPVKFSWDFDASDGIQIDAEGQSVSRRFRTPGTFTVTLTATDIYGIKKPYSTTIKVTVNP